ncbi:hypothetical protein L5515_012720 [Caenorhabditis briggsae]|uniref:Calponin-homology (CH) domain-containing protein n=1 Tax=Caenorhabditis briggsae TaxID=6238 RepID=A0AAE9EZH7_CAEBR|nr:hypothetical protein L5515_012720 [Caenorhabditis briggsae]
MAQPKRLDQEEEVVPAIRHEDAEWKVIQQNTFSRWVNNHLQKAGESIGSLETEFSDGLKLIALAQVLSQKQVGKFNKKVAFRSQKLENVSLALNFFQNEENIKIINIDSTHIVDHNKKLILGLVWTLILHYSISMGWIQEKREDGQDKEETPKQKLLNWIRNRLPGLPISNFTSDWNDGVALGALVNSMAPGALEDWENWSPNEALENTEKAMKSAQDLLKVAPLIAPAEMIHPEIDEMSVMTYLSQFPATKPVIVKPKVHATISNLDKTLLINEPKEFDLKLSRDGYKPKVSIKDADGHDLHLGVKKVDEQATNYKIKFTPTKVGPLNVEVAATDAHTFETQAIPEASVTCQVVPIARLLEYSKTAKVGDTVKFTVADAIEGPVEAIIVDPTGKEHRMVILEGSAPGVHTFEFTVPTTGLHSVNVFHKKIPLTGSPFPLRGKPKNAFKIWGRGIAPEGIRKNDVVGVHVESLDPEENIANSNASLEVVRKDGRVLPISVDYDEDTSTLNFEYQPKEAPEDLEVVVKVGGEKVESHKVHVAPLSSSKIRAFGPGLEGGIVNEPCVFDVEMNGENKDLSFAVEGPSKAEIECNERPDGSAVLSYTPTVAGVYKVGVLADGEHIQDSPFVLRVNDGVPGLKPSATRVTGIDESKVYSVGEKIPFRVDTRLCGVDLVPKVEILDPSLDKISYGAREITPGIFEYTLIPEHAVKHKIDVSVCGVSVPGAPFSLKVKEATDASKLRIYGPGVEGPVYSKEPTRFTIDATQAGPGAVEVALADDHGEKVDLDVLDNQDGSFTVKYTAQRPGVYQLNVVFAGEEISPIAINVKPNVDVSGIRVEGLENAVVTVNVEKEIHVFTTDGENTRIVITSPSGRVVEAIIESTPTGFRVRFTPSEVGNYTIDVTYQDIPIEKSPFTLESIDPNQPGSSEQDDVDMEQEPGESTLAEAEYVVCGSGPARADLVTVSGPGLGPLVAQRSTYVSIDTTNAGFGDIDVYVDGPTRTPLHCVDNQDGILKMCFTPKQPGLYYLRVMFDNEHVPGSPFQIVAVAALLGSPSLLGAEQKRSKTESPYSSISSGSSKGILIGSRLRPTINIGKLEPKSKGLQLLDQVNGKLYNIPLKINPDGTYSSDTPLMEVGEHKMMLLFDEIPVQEATVEVKKGTDVSKCRAYGPGLESAVVGEKAQFELDLDGAGEGALAMEMRGPAKAESRIQDKGNGKCSVEYITKAPGEYEMAIKFGKDEQKEHVKGSPFKAHVDYKKDPSQVIINGLDEVSYRLKQPINFIIDTSKTKDLPVTAHVAPEYAQNPPIVTKSPSNPRHYNVRFVPTGIANTSIPIQILYDGEKVGEKKVKVLPEVEPQLIKILYEKKKESLPITTFASHEGHVPFDVRECGNVKKIEACVFGPDGKERVSHVRSTEQAGIYDVSFPTDMAGEYCVVFYLNGEEVAMKVPVVAEKIGKKEDVLKDDVIFHPEVAENAPTTLTYQHPSETNKKKAKATPSIRVLAARPDAVRLEHIHEIIDNGHRVAERIMFTPTKLGKNTLNVFYGGEQVDHVEYEAIGQLEFERIQAERAKVVEEPEDDVDKYEKKYQGETASSPPQREPAGGSNGKEQLAAPSPAKSKKEQPQQHLAPSPEVEQKPLEKYFTFQFNIRDLGCQAKDLEAVVMPPAQKKEVAEIIDNHDGTILVKYIPKVHGSHELSILQNGAQLQGTPIKFYVDAYGDGWATVYGPGLQNAVVGEPATFTVCAKGSQAKELSVSIEGPAKSQIKIHDNKDGTCSAAWVPPVPGEYKVHVKLGGKAVRDSPFKVLVMGEGQKRSHLSVGSTSEVALPITQSELKGISASIKSPAGIEEPCFVRLLDGGRLGVSFTPRESGEHLITVKRDGKLVPKAPFKIKVDKSQVGDASKVEVTGAGKAKGITLQANELLVDTSKAGYGGLSVSVQGPSKAELTCKEVKAGLIKVLYTPTEPGVYAIAIKFADHHVKDSPLTVQCTGKSAGRVIQTIQKGVDQHGICLPDQESLLFLKLLNTSPMDITARLMDPKGHTDDIEMRDLGQQYYQLKFTPKLEGIHTLSVMYKDAHVNGSPFQFTVGSFSEGGAHKIRAAGQGVVRGETGTLNAFNIYHREAGAGALAVSVEGPSKATLEFKDHKDGNCHVDYKVATPGEYIVAVKFNDQHIPDSPFKVFVAPATGEVRKLELAQFHDQGIPSGKAFTFTVLTHRAKGHLEAKVVAPNNEVDTIDIVPIEDGESYAMRFVPKETGNHFIHVTLDGAPMRDSPFRLRVGGKDLCDPTAIFASGDGLVKGTTGQKCEFVINTANAGAGILTVQMDGPSKATLDAYELEKGYKVRYTPLAPGSYFASVKYNGIHAPGSPFKIPVEGKELGGNGYNETSHVKIDAVAKTSKGTVAVVPEYAGDAAKVTAKGAGLNKFFPGRPAAFQIDTGMAGQNLLMVGVVTTKGPCEEVVVRHQGQGHYVCSYRIPERVKGFVFIKYGDKEIPGSPFAIEP